MQLALFILELNVPGEQYVQVALLRKNPGLHTAGVGPRVAPTGVGCAVVDFKVGQELGREVGKGVGLEVDPPVEVELLTLQDTAPASDSDPDEQARQAILP